MKSKISVVFIFTVFVISAIIYINSDTRKAKETLLELDKEYIPIEYEDGINGTVIFNFILQGFKESPNFKQFELDNSTRRSLHAINIKNDTPLHDVFGVGTKILKESNSNIVLIKSYDKSDTTTYEYRLNNSN